MNKSKQPKVRTRRLPAGMQKVNKLRLETVAFYAAFCRQDLTSAQLAKVDAFICASLNSPRFSEQVKLIDILRSSQGLVDVPHQKVVWTNTELSKEDGSNAIPQK